MGNDDSSQLCAKIVIYCAKSVTERSVFQVSRRDRLLIHFGPDSPQLVQGSSFIHQLLSNQSAYQEFSKYRNHNTLWLKQAFDPGLNTQLV